MMEDNTSLYDITKRHFGENAVGGLSRQDWEMRYVESYDKPINKNKTENKMNKLDANEIKKELYRTKVDAVLARYEKGNLYYNVEVNNGLYQFPISVVNCTPEKLVIPTISGPITKDVEIMRLAEDLGSTAFTPVMPARLLNRWIDKAIEWNDFELLKEFYVE